MGAFGSRDQKPLAETQECDYGTFDGTLLTCRYVCGDKTKIIFKNWAVGYYNNDSDGMDVKSLDSSYRRTQDKKNKMDLIARKHGSIDFNAITRVLPSAKSDSSTANDEMVVYERTFTNEDTIMQIRLDGEWKYACVMEKLTPRCVKAKLLFDEKNTKTYNCYEIKELSQEADYDHDANGGCWFKRGVDSERPLRQVMEVTKIGLKVQDENTEKIKTFQEFKWEMDQYCPLAVWNQNPFFRLKEEINEAHDEMDDVVGPLADERAASGDSLARQYYVPAKDQDDGMPGNEINDVVGPAEREYNMYPTEDSNLSMADDRSVSVETEDSLSSEDSSGENQVGYAYDEYNSVIKRREHILQSTLCNLSPDLIEKYEKYAEQEKITQNLAEERYYSTLKEYKAYITLKVECKERALKRVLDNVDFEEAQPLSAPQEKYVRAENQDSGMLGTIFQVREKEFYAHGGHGGRRLLQDLASAISIAQEE